ncbi:MAG: hypothetical protein KKB50_18360 [Planctomycetes bacterium]|nr:hypothetical protein [Planctomycetota bacterium]
MSDACGCAQVGCALEREHECVDETSGEDALFRDQVHEGVDVKAVNLAVLVQVCQPRVAERVGVAVVIVPLGVPVAQGLDEVGDVATVDGIIAIQIAEPPRPVAHA